MSTQSHTLNAAKSGAKEMAEKAKSHLSETIHDHAEGAREHTLDTVENAASAANAAGREFEPGTLQAAAFEQIGAQINSVAAHLRNKPVDEMVDDVAVFARRNPLLFLGGAALMGFAAARFLKAGNGTNAVSDDISDPWSGHLYSAETSS